MQCVDTAFAYLSMKNPEIDRRRIRRSLSFEEFEWLLRATEQSPPIQHICGQDRVILYILASYTGFRRNELGSVTARSFDFASDPPLLTVNAGYSKHRKTDVIPLRKDLAEHVQAWTQRKNPRPEQPLIAIAGKRTGEMLQRDLDRARATWIAEAADETEREHRRQSSFLAYRDEAGHFADFHALRKTFITNPSRTGAAPKTAQTLARHSTINLTMNVYTTLGVAEQVAAVEALPPVPLPKSRTKPT